MKPVTGIQHVFKTNLITVSSLTRIIGSIRIGNILYYIYFQGWQSYNNAKFDRKKKKKMVEIFKCNYNGMR